MTTLRDRLAERREADQAVCINAKAAARLCHVKQSRINAAVRSGELPALAIGRRKDGRVYRWHIRQVDAERWADDYWRKRRGGRWTNEREPQGIGVRLRAIRRERLMRQEDLGALLGVCFGVVSRWERGITIPTLSQLRTIGEVLELTPYERLWFYDTAAIHSRATLAERESEGGK